nr:putative ribonuclease H-like domain-containing protein [Tanacetum cinerariifolium]
MEGKWGTGKILLGIMDFNILLLLFILGAAAWNYYRFQTLLSQLEIHGDGVSHEDANKKFLRSLPSSWSLVALIMRTKPGLDILSFDDLYNNQRVFKRDVKGSSSYTDEVIYSFFANQSSAPQLDYDDLEQINDDDIEEIDLKWQVAMISMRIKKFHKRTRRKFQFDTKDPVGFDKTKVKCFNCHKIRHSARECRAKGNQESRRRDVGYNGNKTRDNGKRPAYKDDLKDLVTIDGEDIDWSKHVKEDAQNYAMMAYSSSNSSSDKEASDLEDTLVNDRSANGMHVVPPPMTGNYMPSEPNVEIDYSKFTYGPKQTSCDESDSKPSEYAFCESDSINAARQNYSSQAASTSTARKAQRTTFSYQKVNDVGNKSLSAVGENGNTAVKASAEFKGSSVAFGGSNGRITGKGKIKTGRLDFKDVYYMEELKHYNLFSMSQMCDKKNKVLFTDIDCLVLSPNFKLPNENQVLLKIPRQHNMYSFNLKNIDPSGDLACLFAKASIDESNKWHRRLGHVNFKNLNKLVKGNLVRALPFKIFENNHTYVSCQKGKQHKASCKAKTNASTSSTNLINTASIPLSTVGPLRAFNDGELSYANPSKYALPDDPSMPHLEDIYDSPSEGIFTDSSYDDEDPKFPNKVYKVVKDLYGLHQAPRAWFQMSYMGELTFFLRLQVKQKEDGIFISQDKYVAKILKKFDFLSVKTASTPIETQKPLVKDKEVDDVDVHLYRFQVTPKTLHLHAMKRIFRYLKGQPKLELASPKQTAHGKNISNSLMAGRLPKTTLPTSTMASSIIYLATNQKFNFSRYILLSLVKNIEDIYDNPSLTKKVFANMKRVGTGFSGLISIPTEPSTSKPHKKHKPKKQQTQAPKVPSLEPSPEHKLPSPSNEPLPGGKDSLKLRELMDLCTYLLNKVLELESEVIEIKSTYRERIEKLEGRVDRLEEENKVSKELYSVYSKVDIVAPIVEKEKSFKQERIIANINEDVSVLRRRRGVVIQDPMETTSTFFMHSEVQSKDKGKELNADINWNAVIKQVKRSERLNDAVMKYQALKRKPVTEVQARKNKIIYLKNMPGYKMNYFKRMTYSEIRPLFEKYYNYNQAFLEEVNEEVTVPEKEVEVEDHKREGESLEKEITKKQKIDEKAEELKSYLQIVSNDDDDVYTEC